MPGTGRTARLTSALCGLLAAGLLVGPANASAQTYYVSPNGSGNTCSQADPCFITAADSTGPGSEVVIAPGDYKVGAEQLSYLNETNIHGVAGQPRPRIFSTHGFAAMDLGNNLSNMTLRHIELYTTGPTGISVNGTGVNTVEDVIVSATGAGGIGCATPVRSGGSVTVKNSICRGMGAGLGTTCVCGGTATATLRNVTAIGDTFGISYSSPMGAGSPTDYTVTATNVIARHTGGTGADVRAEGGTTGADVAINLANSNYATQQEDVSGAPAGTAAVTDPGTGTNQIAAPVFVNAAAGDFHQAAGSPTIGAGVNDAANGTEDIDGQQREIGTVDIGADERGLDTTTSVSCTPGSTSPGYSVTCTGTVTDGGASPAPTGQLAFGSNGTGNFDPPSCTLTATMVAGQSACSVSYVPGEVGTHEVTATSLRDLTHEGSQGTFALGVSRRNTSTAVSCSPGSTQSGSPVTCTGTVTDIGGASPSVPTGLLAFNSNIAGSFNPSSCALAATMMAGQSACSVSYLPSQAGAHQVTATFSPDLSHEGSQGAFALTVTAPPATQTPSTTTTPAPPKKKCKRKKHRAAAAKKCKKRK